MKHTIRRHCPRFGLSHLQLAIALGCVVQLMGFAGTDAAPVVGPHVFTRPLNGGAAVSVQAILSSDSDTALIPVFVGRVDTSSAAGGVISRTNDWLYYQPPASLVVTDSFNYVLTNLVQQSATGTVTIVAVSNFVSTNVLKISALGNSQQIEFLGEVGSYYIQSSSNLLAWQTVNARLAWPTGYFRYLNPGAEPGRQKNFYRTATGAFAPAITNYQAVGTNNVQVDFQLGTEGGLNSPYPATIESLPALGYLFQDDGSVISNVPAPVTGTGGSLHYFGPPGGTGSNYTSFQYKITRPSDGLDSLPATFQLTLAPDVAVITTPQPHFPEDIGGLIQLTATDPDLRYPSNHLQFFVYFAPVNGTLYQVKPDGTTDLTNVIKNFTYVSNTNGWVYYQPPALGYYDRGAYDSIQVGALNSFNVLSGPYSLPIYVYFVNHPPSASDVVITGPVNLEPLNGFPSYYDPDFNATTICFPTLPARGNLYVSYGDTPGTLVTASNHCFALPYALNFYSDSRTNGLGCYPDGTDIGSPYTTATYFVTDADGASSTTNTITFNVTPLKYPFPFPSGPASYTNLVNSQSTIVFSATNSTGIPGLVIFYLQTVPTHGNLYLGTRLIGAAGVPSTLPQNPSLTYVPNAGYYSSRDGLDSFAYRTGDQEDTLQCDAFITLHVLAPPIFKFNMTTISVTVNSNGVTQIPGVINNLPVIPRDAPTNAILQLTLAGTPAGSAPYGYFTLSSTNGLTSIVTNVPNSLQIQGTLASLASAVTSGIKYYATPTSAAGGMTAILNDLGTTGLGTNTSSESITMLYGCSDCILGP